MTSTDKEEDEANKMTAKRLVKICRKKGLFDTPEYNDSLYLNHEGFDSIANLEPYHNIKSLFLEGNSISTIENIDHLHKLRGLYLRDNLIKTISNLDGLTNLKSLDLANNQISRIENLSHLQQLETLNLEQNKISNVSDLEQISENKAVSTLNLMNNKIKTAKEGMKLIKLLSKLPNLRALYLKGNECITKMDFYRKHTISTIRTLTFLDDRPVFEHERRLNDAWIRGGAAAEDLEKKLIQKEKNDKRDLTRKKRREQYEARRKAMYERIEREQKEQEASERVEDDTSEESKVNMTASESSDDSKVEEQAFNVDDINLPGMVQSMYEID